MTDREKLKRHPAIILRRAMMHLRKRYAGHRGYNGRENISILKHAMADVFRADLADAIAELKKTGVLEMKTNIHPEVLQLCKPASQREPSNVCGHKCHRAPGLNPWVEECPICGCLNANYDPKAEIPADLLAMLNNLMMRDA